MSESEKNSKPSSELRFDLVSKDWVVIATGRGKRPEMFANQERKKEEVATKDCPFCNLGGQAAPLLELKNKEGQLEVVVIPNKFPAFSHADSLRERAIGPYSVADGVGFHEVVIICDHQRSLAELPLASVRLVIDAYQSRYLELIKQKLVNYVSVFHNHGREAGASVSHPHSQILAIPLIDPDLRRSLAGSRLFFDMHSECVHCRMMEWDMEDKQRIIFENDEFIVLAPFASRVAFEIRIYPKDHQAYFERINEKEKDFFAQALQAALIKIFKGLNDPSYNFFIHTAPCDGHDYSHYHWHLEILPKTSIWAGFELGTGIEISTVEPEKAAEYLRKI